VYKSLVVCSYFMVSLTVASKVQGSRAESCKPLDSTDRPEIENFVKTWYKLPTNQTVTLTDSSIVDASCYRKLVFRASVPAPLLTLYLTPDGKHLVSGLMDLTVDPAIAQRKMREELADKLASGAVLTSGDEKAPAKMVVFSDFQCPYCKKFASIINELTPEERVQLQTIYRQLPLNIHPWARDAAALSTCVALQDKNGFWRLHDFLFAHQEELTKETLQSKALEFLSGETSVDTKGVSACLSQKLFEDSLHRDEQLAMDLGITGTPSVFLNGRRVSVRSVGDLRNAIRTARQEDAPMQQAAPKTASAAEETACAHQSRSQCASDRPTKPAARLAQQ
jgi:protein-disulfide isomerase